MAYIGRYPKTAGFLKAFGIIILVVGVIASIALSEEKDYYTSHFNTGLCIVGVISSVFTSVILFALAKLVEAAQMYMNINLGDTEVEEDNEKYDNPQRGEA